MLLTDLLTIDHIRIPLQSRTKNEVLRELVEVITQGMTADEEAEIQQAVLARESILSTGIGFGVAIPHGKTGIVSEIRMAAGRSEDPIEFNALDGTPVQLFFLLIGPEASAGPHIKALSRISRLVRREEVRTRLIEAEDGAAFLDALQSAEERAAEA